jgi:hypothetical protein
MHSDLPQASSNLERTSRLVRQIQIRLLTLRAWVPVTRQQEHPQVSVNRCGRHVIHCAEHRITYLARADFIVNPVTGLFILDNCYFTDKTEKRVVTRRNYQLYMFL